jgi:polyhydroxyalkanoate synthase
MAEREASSIRVKDRGPSRAFVLTKRGSAPPPARPLPEVHPERDDDPTQRLAEALDRAFSYALSRVTLGLSPAALAEAYFNWLVHLALAPGKQLQLTQKALRNTLRFWNYVATCALQQRPDRVCIEPLPTDKRFSADAWHAWPFNAIHQAFLLRSTSSGGTTPRPGCAASPPSMSARLTSPRGRCSTSFHPPTSC